MVAGWQYGNADQERCRSFYLRRMSGSSGQFSHKATTSGSGILARPVQLSSPGWMTRTRISGCKAKGSGVSCHVSGVYVALMWCQQVELIRIISRLAVMKRRTYPGAF